MVDKFLPGQMVDWINDQGQKVARCRIVKKSTEEFYYDDTSCPCWVVNININGGNAEIAEKNLISVRCN